MPSVRVNGVELGYSREGSAGDPVVFVHGAWEDRDTWRPVAAALASAMQTLTYDRRGYATSGSAAVPRVVATDTEDLAGLLRATDHYPSHVVGHGYGGIVAVALASAHPELVRSLALHEPPYIGLLDEDPAEALEADRFRSDRRVAIGQVDAGDAEAAARTMRAWFTGEPEPGTPTGPAPRFSAERYAARWRAEALDPESERPPAAPALGEILVPVVLTEGTESPGFLRRIVAALAPRFSNAVRQPLRGAGHDPQRTHPDLYVATLARALLERNVPLT